MITKKYRKATKETDLTASTKTVGKRVVER
jgi:hypothetical protein